MRKIVGFTCGSFDLLHAGHALMLKECKKYCDYLIVGLQSDPTIDRSDKNKPVMELAERKIMLESIRYVDKIITYNTELDLYDLLIKLQSGRSVERVWDYDFVRIIGSDWKGKEFTGHNLGLETVFNTRTHNFSTSELRKRVYIAEHVNSKYCKD